MALELLKELLGVATALGARSSVHISLDSLPVHAIHLDCLQKAEMLIFCPLALVRLTIFGGKLGLR